MVHIERVLGVCLVHCTGTTAGFMESLKDKVPSSSSHTHFNIHRYHHGFIHDPSTISTLRSGGLLGISQGSPRGSRHCKNFVDHVFKYAVCDIKPTCNHQIFNQDVQLHSTKFLWVEGSEGQPCHSGRQIALMSKLKTMG